MRFNKLIIAGLTILAILILAFVLVPRSEGPAGPRPQPGSVARPPIPSYQPDAPENVVFSLSADFSYTAPADLSVYSVTGSAPETAERIVSSLTENATRSVIPSNSETITAWSWDTGEATLSLPERGSATFAFTDYSAPGNGFVLEELRNIMSVPENISITEVVPPEPASEAVNFPLHPDAGTILRSTYSYTRNGAPLLLSGPSEQSVIIYTTAGGGIIHASLVFPPQNIVRINNVSPVTTDEMLAALNNGSGLFVTSNIYGPEYTDPPEFTSVTISKATPSLLLDPLNGLLLPSLLLDGTGTEGTKTTGVRYLLMAYTQE